MRSKITAAREKLDRQRKDELVFSTRLIFVFVAIILVRDFDSVLYDIWIAFLIISAIGISLLEWWYKRELDKLEKALDDE